MAFSDPEKIIEEVGIREGSIVVDLGAGSGFYSLAAAKATGDAGKVYAVDIQQELLSRLKNTAQTAKLRNIEVVHGNIEKLHGTKIADGLADIVIVANVLFQVEDKEGLADEVMRLLKSGGRLLVVDWADSFGGMGPEESAVFNQQDSRGLFEKKGFAFDTGIPAGDHHYGLIFRKN